MPRPAGPPHSGGQPPRRPRSRQRPAQDTDPGGRPQRRAPRAERPAASERAEQSPRRNPAVEEPPLADDIRAADLDRTVRAGLRSLPEGLAERVARHLVAAGRLIDEDPDGAAAHAQYARGLAPRLAPVREAAGIVAYRCGDYATALSELRAVRRMTGDPSYLPVMADCERGLGRPERALALAAEPDARRLAPAERVELAIVVSGARRDRGETKAAVLALQGPDLERSELQPWSVRLWYAYADALLAAGRRDDARQWFEAAAAADEAGDTDADERLAGWETAPDTDPGSDPAR